MHNKRLPLLYKPTMSDHMARQISKPHQSPSWTPTSYRDAVQRSMRTRLHCAMIGGTMRGRFWDYRLGKGTGSTIRVERGNEPWNPLPLKG